MHTVRKFALARNFLAAQTEDFKQYLPARFEGQSRKGLQLVRPGLLFHTFVREDGPVYTYRAVPVLEAAPQSLASEAGWEFVCRWHGLLFFRRPLRGTGKAHQADMPDAEQFRSWRAGYLRFNALAALVIALLMAILTLWLWRLPAAPPLLRWGALFWTLLPLGISAAYFLRLLRQQ